MIYKCIIIDDEQPARRLLQNYCNKIEDLEVIASFKSALDAIDFLKNNEVDIIFLDIQMPEITGIDFLKIIQRKEAKIIFTTAYRDYALEGFDLDVTDYLLKPIEFFRFIKAIEKVKKLGLKEENQTEEKEKKDNDFILLKSGKKQFRIKKDSINYIKSENEYVTYYFSDRNKLLIYGSIKEIISNNILNSNFLRVHRSYIVNMNKIDYVEGNRIVTDTIKIPISETYRNDFFEKWQKK
ncbi:LytR/AlgR family response regulator transcription factor [Aureivirga sp. CE67]|uniref:LytR/AlgR family response regulator transcription factor n=1 Tax=Aureivirga sp. CE67 TaxID=1788983 RepID=UPI0018CB310A|nr:LytTR family DNA-binding domain-containing protein [Aureivirga sp. CE67]